MNLLPIVTAQLYSYLLTLFIASKRNPYIQNLFRTCRISLVINAITNTIVAPIIHDSNFMRALFIDHITITWSELPTQLELNPPPMNRTIDSLWYVIYVIKS